MRHDNTNELDVDILRNARRFINRLDRNGDFWTEGAGRAYTHFGKLTALIDEQWAFVQKRLAEGGHAELLYTKYERSRAASYITAAQELLFFVMTHPRFEDAVVDEEFGDAEPLFRKAGEKFLKDLEKKINELQVRFNSRKLEYILQDHHDDALAGRLENFAVALYFCDLGLALCETAEYDPIMPQFTGRWKRLKATVLRNQTKAIIDQAKELEDEAHRLH